MKKEIEKTLIGRRDIANLPEFGLFGVAVKVDSGAYTSSIHVTSCKEVVLEGVKILELLINKLTVIGLIRFHRPIRRHFGSCPNSIGLTVL